MTLAHSVVIRGALCKVQLAVHCCKQRYILKSAALCKGRTARIACTVKTADGEKLQLQSTTCNLICKYCIVMHCGWSRTHVQPELLPFAKCLRRCLVQTCRVLLCNMQHVAECNSDIIQHGHLCCATTWCHKLPLPWNCTRGIAPLINSLWPPSKMTNCPLYLIQVSVCLDHGCLHMC